MAAAIVAGRNGRLAREAGHEVRFRRGLVELLQGGIRRGPRLGLVLRLGRRGLGRRPVQARFVKAPEGERFAVGSKCSGEGAVEGTAGALAPLEDLHRQQGAAGIGLRVPGDLDDRASVAELPEDVAEVGDERGRDLTRRGGRRWAIST